MNAISNFKLQMAKLPRAISRFIKNSKLNIQHSPVPLSLAHAVETANAWRRQYNPLPDLTLDDLASQFDQYLRGDYSRIQWTWHHMEQADATISSVITRRQAAVKKMDWHIKLRPDLTPEQAALAERQAQHLRTVYDTIGNLRPALEHLVLATFRGYSILEKRYDSAGTLIGLDPIPHWFFGRDGMFGAWKFAPQGHWAGHGSGEPLPLDRVLLRECHAPLNRILALCWLRKTLSQKDWDAFIETYGVPALFIIQPANTDPNKQKEFQAIVERIIGDARGVLPAGSDVKTVDNGARGVNPFRDHLAYQDEAIVLAATGGKLTVLNEATGIGGGQAGVHDDAFDDLAQAEALEISEVFQQQVDLPALRAAFPDQPVLAYWELSHEDKPDVATVISNIAALAAAGYDVDLEQAAELTGLKLTRRPLPAAPAAPWAMRNSECEMRNAHALSNNCGTGEGGFQPGNECAQETGIQELTTGQFEAKWKKADGRGATLGVPRVNSQESEKTPSGCSAGLASQRPSAIETLINRMFKSNAELRVAPFAPLADLLAQVESQAQELGDDPAALADLLEKAAARAPSLLNTMDLTVLVDQLEAGLGQAVLQGVTEVKGKK